MKTELKEIETTGVPSIEVEQNSGVMSDFISIKRVKITFELFDIPHCNIDDIILKAPVNVPEKISEFCKENDITKKELVKWLNENYK